MCRRLYRVRFCSARESPSPKSNDHDSRMWGIGAACRRRSISSFSSNFRRFNSAIFKSSVELCADVSAISSSSALCRRSSSERCAVIVISLPLPFSRCQRLPHIGLGQTELSSNPGWRNACLECRANCIQLTTGQGDLSTIDFSSRFGAGRRFLQ